MTETIITYEIVMNYTSSRHRPSLAFILEPHLPPSVCQVFNIHSSPWSQSTPAGNICLLFASVVFYSLFTHYICLLWLKTRLMRAVVDNRKH